MPTRSVELDIEALKLRILRIVEREDLDSAVLVAALADVVGLTAATLDAYAGAQPFENRMDDFIIRARAAYQRTITRMAARPAGRP